MLSHDPVRTRLREALEHSAVGLFLRGSRTVWADAWSHARMPNKSEIRGLEQRGNECADWTSVRLLGTGSLVGIRDCHFEGHCILRLGEKVGKTERGPLLRHSMIRDSLIGVCTIHSVGLVDRVIVEDGARLHTVGACTGSPGSRFCLGLALHPGSETGARRVFLADGLRLDDCTAMSALPPVEQEALAHEWSARLKPCVSDFAYVGKDARIEHTRFVEDSYVGAGAVIRGAAAVRGCVLASVETVGTTKATSVFIGDAVIAEQCVFEAGVRLESAAQARRSLFLEYSGAEQAGHVADAVIGPNTVVAKGEVTASLVGPFVGFHHQALLIGTLWPEGRGNVGYGANVGSNHTGRKPDQELRPGEGTFFGLGCAVKFPADFAAAPYSLLATGVVTPPQKIAFPFSLIAHASTLNASADVSASGLNEMIPGWMWSENAYALIRNAYKYADRNKALHHPLPALTPPPGSPLAGTFLAADLFAPRVLGHVADALTRLKELPPGLLGALTGKELPGVGKNFVRAHRLDEARAAYSNYLAFALIRHVLWEPGPPIKPLTEDSHVRALAELADVNLKDTSGLLKVFGGLGVAVETSLRRDAERGTGVFDDYAVFHGEAALDPVCIRLQAELKALEPVLRARLGQIG